MATNLEDIEQAIKEQAVTTPTKIDKTLTSADTEYPVPLPAGTKKFRVHLRDQAAFRLAYVTGHVAASVQPFETIPANNEKYEDGLKVSSLTLYLATPVAGKTAEIEVWV